MHAYDIDVGPWRSGNPDRGEDGWAFGLPPGIAAEQWPLDPVTGYPLVHGFTLLLPQDYRVHGPDIVAVSFFATPADSNDGGAAPWNDAVSALIAAPGNTPPGDPALLPWWERARLVHPRTARMEDILGYGYAAVLLTQAEYDGPSCPPPPPVDAPNPAAAPAWLGEGAAVAFERFSGRSPFVQVPPDPWSIHCPLRLIQRTDDPNAGIAPQDTWDNQDAENGYTARFFTDADGEWHPQPWSEGHAANHLGGTMQPCQATPAFSPYYIEFEEGLGGYNFGGGNAQLDLRDLKFDWACG
ncbi:hypothetical protein [Sphingomonas xinjiangensis]|uniref:DUF1963 domain-containing protein n=1 Tax=Sphingomonas xinjiangensis TaxID=643568 RepID=A0A840YK09_9SPHN|nr:hypothetical protein [Sphingomonas xinjiangensis]MBB5709230.1 hypothetical protein [Sphingomonas xinjiangensis]